MFADKIKHPILLIHGMADDTPGTFPIQRSASGVKGNGGIVRYVQLPMKPDIWPANPTTHVVGDGELV